jgi:hypothetical protein
MPLSDVSANAGFYVWRNLRFEALGKKRLMNFGGTETSGATYNDVTVIVVPLEHGAWADPQFLPYF